MNRNKFEEWLYETESFSLRCERIYDDLVACCKTLPEEKDIHWKRTIEWLQWSYDIGFEAGKNNKK